MRAIRCKPGEAPEICEIDNTLEALQAEVGGYIEHVQLAPGVGLLCNEEGKLLDLPFNLILRNEPFAGTILILGTKGEEFCDLSLAQCSRWKGEILQGREYARPLLRELEKRGGWRM